MNTFNMILSTTTSSMALLLVGVNLCAAQHTPAVWNYKLDRVDEHELVLTMTAFLAQGWHIYSQHLSENGPMPTNIKGIKNEDYIFIGKAEEKGSAVKFYDSLYETDIVWYADQVSFLQRISMHRMIPEIRGTIEYMVCNSSLCVPCVETFNINTQTQH